MPDLETLIAEAYARLDDEAYDDALALAHRIEALCHTSAFEIGARALSAQGDDEAAVAYLQKGLDLAGGPWSNWQFLANLLDDLGRREASDAAYEAALGCDGVDVAMVRLNQAIAASRQGRPEAALARLDDPAFADADADLRSEAATVRVEALSALGRWADAAARGRAVLDGDEEPGDRLLAATLRAEHALGRPADAVVGEAAAWLDRHDPTSERVLGLLRDVVGGPSSPTSAPYRVVVDVRLPEPTDDGAVGYMMPMWVVADDADESARLARLLVVGPGDVRVVENQRHDDDAWPTKGVIRRFGRLFYRGDAG